MFAEISLFTILSTVIFFLFISLGVVKFGLLSSYSAYSTKWGKAVPINNMNLWSIVTFVAAFLLCPAMLQLAVGSVWQFLGFLTPVYLIVVSCTPNWETDKKEQIVHRVAAIICLIGGLLWLILVRHALGVMCGVVIFILTLALLTGTMKSCAVFWGEMMMFIAVYLTVLLAIL